MIIETVKPARQALASNGGTITVSLSLVDIKTLRFTLADESSIRH